MKLFPYSYTIHQWIAKMHQATVIKGTNVLLLTRLTAPLHTDAREQQSVVIVTCTGLRLTYRRVLYWMIGFIAPYTFTQFRTTGNYSAIAILHTY
jgi:hypothetical protein